MKKRRERKSVIPRVQWVIENVTHETREIAKKIALGKGILVGQYITELILEAEKNQGYINATSQRTYKTDHPEGINSGARNDDNRPFWKRLFGGN